MLLYASSVVATDLIMYGATNAVLSNTLRMGNHD